MFCLLSSQYHRQQRIQIITNSRNMNRSNDVIPAMMNTADDERSQRTAWAVPKQNY